MSQPRATEVPSIVRLLAERAEAEGITDASIGQIDSRRAMRDEDYQAGVNRALRALRRGGSRALRAEVEAVWCRSRTLRR